MTMFTLITLVLLLYVIAASICDIKWLEVPDWLNYSLIIVGLASGLGLSLLRNNWLFFLESLAGFGLAYVIALVFYYTGQWGGGDAKHLIGIGAVLGLGLKSEFPYIDITANSLLGFNFLSFLFYSMIGGLIFGLVFIIYKALKSKKAIERLKEHILKGKWFARVLVLSLLILLISFLFSNFGIKIILMGLSFTLVTTYLLFVVVKEVEANALTVSVPISKLTPGDWIVEPIKVDGNIICKKRKTGLSEEELALLRELEKKGKIQQVKVKYGFPFIPGFLVGFLLLLAFGNLFIFVTSLIIY